MKESRGTMRRDLIVGLTLVVLLSSLITYGGVAFLSRRNFDHLVQQSDISLAQTIASNLATLYEKEGSLASVGDMGLFLRGVLPPRPESGKGSEGEARENFHAEEHGGNQFPLVITDVDGTQSYPAVATDAKGSAPSKFRPEDGVPITAGGKIVGYVFFKSMLRMNYDPQQREFLASLTASIGIAIVLGAFFAFLLGNYFAYRFTRPVKELDMTVQRLASGESGARAAISGTGETRHLAINFNNLAEKLERAEAARKNLFADIAHELRTPVSVIQGNLEMIQAGIYVPDRDRVASLLEETRLLSDLIGDLRNISDLEMGTVPLRNSSVSVAEIVAETIEKYRPLFVEKALSLRFSSRDAETALSWADRDRLRQVIRNLLANALKYATEGKDVETVCERAWRDGKPTVRVSVLDRGPGIPEGELEKIFERFYRLDPSRNRDSGGRGLGLAICKQIVEASGGVIWADNRPDGGLRVSFEMPVTG